MIIDAYENEAKRIDADVCIIGAGAAGITLANEFIGQALKVVLLEAGGYYAETETQNLYKGEIIGNPYFPLEVARLRQFGGSTGHWGGACWPLEASDFERRDWVPNSGWPMSYDELVPFYKRAQDIIGIGPFNYSEKDWSDSETSPVLPLQQSGVRSKFYQNSNPPKRFGEAFRKQIRKAKNVTAVLHANVVHIQQASDSPRIDFVKVSTLRDQHFNVHAKTFVQATGGLENPRLLLQSNDIQQNGIGNQEDLVGRYFMDHIHIPSSRLLIDKDIKMRFYTSHTVRGTVIRGGLGLDQSLLKSEKILNSWLGLGLRGAPPQPKAEGRVASVKKSGLGEIRLNNMLAFGHEVVTREKPPSSDMNLHVIDADSFAEQAPNPLSRVMLSNETDRLGMRRIQLDWRLSDLDRKSVRRSLEIFGMALGASNIGRLRIVLDGDDDSWSEPERVSKISWPFGSYHHMGTTRMHESPKQGVVDGDCRVHGVNNLYIAGSSVFPTSGYANPTLTIVALACRLADHIKKGLV